MVTRDRFHATVVGVNATVPINGDQVGGFLAITAGTITINRGSTVLLNAFPVTAGQYVPLPIYVGLHDIKTFVAAGGASGTLLV